MFMGRVICKAVMVFPVMSRCVSGWQHTDSCERFFLPDKGKSNKVNMLITELTICLQFCLAHIAIHS